MLLRDDTSNAASDSSRNRKLDEFLNSLAANATKGVGVSADDDDDYEDEDEDSADELDKGLEIADDWETQKAKAKESAQKSLGKNRKSPDTNKESFGKDKPTSPQNPLGQKSAGSTAGQKPSMEGKLGSGTGGVMGKSPSGSTGGASKMPGASGGAGGGAGKMGGGGGGKGGGMSVDPDEVKKLAEQAASGDIKGAVKGGVKVGEKALLEKGYMASIDALVPTFGLSFLAMELIVFIGMILRVKISWWMRWLVHGVNLLIIILIGIFCIIIFAAVVGACKASGLDGSGWIATFASGPVGWAVDLYRGDSLGSNFIAVCKEIGFITK